MDVDNIFKNYKKYIDIYENDLKTLDNEASTFLLNSLYLSVYTTFEYFLDFLIQRYVENITLSSKGIKLEDLKGSIAMKYFINNNKNDKKLHNLLMNPQTKTFDSIRSVLYGKIPREELSKYLKFEFLHDNKLKEHYPDIFEQIFNERDLLKNINLSRTEMLGGVEKVENISAEVFILRYRDIRNSIAHENYKFSVENEQFKEYVENFQKIIKCMIDKFETVTGFSVDSKSNNILESL